MHPTKPTSTLRLKRLVLTRSIASLFLMTSASQAIDWNGSASGDWNTGANWNGGTVPGPGQDASIFSIGGNIPTISADLISIPTDIRVGQFNGGNGQLNHTAGSAATGAGNWMTVGAGTGSIGIYNLANISTTGGTLTGFGTGSGSMTVNNSNFNVGGTNNEQSGTGTANINTTGTLNAGEINVGWWGNGTINLDAGTVNGNGATYIGRTSGTGAFKMSGGTVTRDGEVFVGVDAGSTGTLAVSGGTVTINNWLNVGRDSGTGSLTMTGGTMSVQREVRIGWGAGGNGTLALSGGAVLSGGTFPTETNNVAVGENGGTGTATVNGAGTQLNSTGDVYVGNGDNSTGTMTVSGGTVNAGNWMGVGRDGSTGTLTINGTGVVNQGSTNADGTVALEMTNNGKASTATVNLDGGTLSVNRIINGAGGNTNIYLNGGTLKARVNRGDFLQGLTSATVKAGGAIIDTDGREIGINQALVGSDTSLGGGLTKNGTGTLTLTGVNTYTGATTVNGGILQISGDAQFGTVPSTPTANIFLNNGEIFNNDSAPTLDANRTVTLGVGDGFIRAGYGKAFTINGKITGSGGLGIVWDGAPVVLANAANDYTGDTTIGAVGNGFFAPGSALLSLGVDNALPFGAGKGNVVFGINPDNPGNNATLDLNGHSAQINGLSGGTQAVVTNQSGGGTYTLTVGTNNQTSTFSGTIGQTSGQLALTKVGGGVLSLTNANNTYTGATTVSNGTLLVSGSIGASAVTVNGGTLGGAGGTVGTTVVNAGGTLAPGPLIGTLNFSGALTLAGTAAFEIDKTGFTLSADLANVTTGTLTLGGTLNVTATGDVLAAGDSFNLFDATAFAGSFTTLNLPSLGAGLSWETGSLGVNGTIAVIPEPGAAVSLFGGLGLLLGLRRRRTR